MKRTSFKQPTKISHIRYLPTDTHFSHKILFFMIINFPYIRFNIFLQFFSLFLHSLSSTSTPLMPMTHFAFVQILRFHKKRELTSIHWHCLLLPLDFVQSNTRKGYKYAEMWFDFIRWILLNSVWESVGCFSDKPPPPPPGNVMRKKWKVNWKIFGYEYTWTCV